MSVKAAESENAKGTSSCPYTQWKHHVRLRVSVRLLQLSMHYSHHASSPWRPLLVCQPTVAKYVKFEHF